jgi:hypothetical protein
MASTFQNPDMVLREALIWWHQKATFIGSINRQYDDSYSDGRGGKIGDSLRVRIPIEAEVGDGETITPQEVVEESLTLRVQRRKHVALQFSGKELTQDVDNSDVSTRVLAPQVAKLVSVVEADTILDLLKQVPGQVDQNGTAFTFDTLLAAREVLNNNLCPNDGRRTAILKSRHARKLSNDLKANQNPASDISGIIRDGMIERVASFGDIYESSHIVDLTTGTAAEGDTSYLTNQVAAQDNTESLIIDTGSTTFKLGEVIEIEGVNEVHPETKVDTGRLAQFVLTADVAANATALPISPKLVASGPRQNVSNGAANNKKIFKRGAGNGELLNLSTAYHENAFTFITADLVKPRGGAMVSRKVKDNVSMRLVEDYEIRTDLSIMRLDILYGKGVLKPRGAVRMHADG